MQVRRHRSLLENNNLGADRSTRAALERNRGYRIKHMYGNDSWKGREKKGGAHFSLATLCALGSCSDTICGLSWAMAPGKEVCACLHGASRGCY